MLPRCQHENKYCLQFNERSDKQVYILSVFFLSLPKQKISSNSWDQEYFNTGNREFNSKKCKARRND